ncbi:ComEC/Rec2 family competence protein [Patescibacteria group bacterium]
MFEFLGEAGRGILERKSYVVLVACFGFVAGIIAHSFFPPEADAPWAQNFSFFWIYNALLLAGILILIFWQSKLARLIFIGVFFIIAGFARFDLGIEKNNVLQEYWGSPPHQCDWCGGKDVRILGSVSVEPSYKLDKQQLVIEPIEIGREKIKSREKILVTTNLYPQYKYGDKLKFDCKLVEPKKFDTFDYARYLSVQNIYGLCYYPSLNPPVSSPDLPLSSLAMTKLLQAKSFLITKINQTLHEPFASFLSGLVVGARNAIPQDLLDNFQRTGTTHIIAISGWNITFLGLMFLPVLFHLRIKRKPAFYVMIGVIILFVLLVGVQASVVRAGIMGVLALYAKAFSRYNHAGRALLYSIVLMFLINSSIVYDVGFWLSVSATFGLIYFGPIVNKLLKLYKIKFMLLRENLETTISAVVFTLPISSFVFGYVSLWALPVNIIILPFVAYAIVFALMALPAIFLPQIITQILFLPSAAILNFIVKIINLFGAIPFGYLPLKINFWIMLILYGGILYFTIWRHRSEQSE